MPYVTQAHLEQILQFDVTAEPDSTVTQYIAWAESIVQTWLGRSIEQLDAISEVHDPLPVGMLELFIRRPPIRALTSVTVDGTVWTEGVDDDFLTYSDGWLLSRTKSWANAKPQGIVVAYDGGYATGTEPDDLIHGTALVVGRIFSDGAAALPEGAPPGVKSVALAGSDAVTYENAGRFVADKYLTPAAKQILSPYRWEPSP